MSAIAKAVKVNEGNIHLLPHTTLFQLADALEERVLPDRRIRNQPLPAGLKERRVRDRRRQDNAAMGL